MPSLLLDHEAYHVHWYHLFLTIMYHKGRTFASRKNTQRSAPRSVEIHDRLSRDHMVK